CVGKANHAVRLSRTEVEDMSAPEEEVADPAAAAQAPGEEAAEPAVEFPDFALGDSVMVIDGPSATMHATITEMNVDTQRVKALVEIFGRETPVELRFNQIQRV